MKKLTITQLQNKLWEECKRIIRAIYLNSDGSWTCFTCGKRITDKVNAHTSHFIPKSVCGAFLKYDLRNLRVCCMACNVWGGGMGAMFYKHLVEVEGQIYVDELFKDKQRNIKAYDHYTYLLDYYKTI